MPLVNLQDITDLFMVGICIIYALDDVPNEVISTLIIA